MDTIGVSNHKMKARRESKRASSGKRGIKVVYISSPMKVTTSASEFRATVQELTGQDSDVAELMEKSTDESTCHNSLANVTSPLSSISNYGEEQHQSGGTVYCNSDDTFTGEYFSHPLKNESPADSDRLPVEGFDGNLFSMPPVERSLRENNFPLVFQESAWLDVLN